LPLAFSSALRFSLTGFDRSLFSIRSKPLFEFRVPPEFYPASPSRSAAADQPLSWALAPFSTCRFGGPPDRGFWLPATFRLQGFATLLTVYSLRALAGSVSHRQRSWDSPFGAIRPCRYPAVSDRMSPPTVSSHRCSRRRSVGRPGGPRFLGFYPAGLPCRP
jgi:hypothetical protein